ncbi:MAG: hypothetical protein METHP_00552 [Methanoregula sp. SKADARSKE-2]|nr:MAG: hypothetical protein METHP_00552 [Methanoregula sp. SKADARSKE-2]
MKKRIAPPDEVLALLKVTQTDWYGHVRGFPYRVSQFRRMHLYDLGHAILSAFRFYRDHLFGFYENLHRYYHSQEGYVLTSGVGIGNRFPGVKRAKIATVFPEPKKKMLFVYDFGDEWRFIVQAKGRALPVDGVKYPVVIESCGDNPDQYPEDEPGPPAPVPVVTAGDLDRQAAVAWQKKRCRNLPCRKDLLNRRIDPRKKLICG